jgi:tRNA dimethylallyltransferase
MSIHPFQSCLFLTGPTASGKTAVGVALAERVGAEVVALDSMTLYRGMDIGTAKPTAEERRGVPHHLIDVLEPWESASVAEYRARAIEAVRDVESRGRRALFVGGTPLYLKALLRGLFEGPGADPGVRAALEAEPGPALHARLAEVDPPTAARLHPNDRRRLVRALEVHALTGRPISALQAEHDRPARGLRAFALERPRPELHDRIDRRVVAMFAGGLLDEARRLREGPRPIHRVPAQAAGYAEAFDVLDGRLPEPEAIARTQARTRQLARRQATWFRGLEEVVPWPVPPDEPPEAAAARLAGAMLGGD